MRQKQPTSDWAILTSLSVLLGFVMALAIGLGYAPELFQAAQWIAHLLSPEVIEPIR
jgi:hypothetical protein